MLLIVRSILASHQGEVNTARFFKTQSGGYAQGDQFLGISNSTLRLIVKMHGADINYDDISDFLYSKINEERLLALLFLVDKYCQKSDVRTFVYNFYLHNLSQVDNWNLVDSSAHLILGRHLYDTAIVSNVGNCDILFELLRNESVWFRRIAIVATWYFIRNHNFTYALNIASQLLQDKHDLIHKATGWMLREIGKKDQETLRVFLHENAHIMPRTMLRYAIERLPDRRHYLN